MRCPAIEGIETDDLRSMVQLCLSEVECVAPLLRGLKPSSILVLVQETICPASNALPRY